MTVKAIHDVREGAKRTTKIDYHIVDDISEIHGDDVRDKHRILLHRSFIAPAPRPTWPGRRGSLPSARIDAQRQCRALNIAAPAFCT